MATASRTLRGALTAVAAAAAASAATWLCREPVQGLRSQLEGERSWRGVPLELLLPAVASCALAAVVLWFCVVALVTVVEAVSGWSPALVRTCSPPLVRRTVLLCCGVALGSGTVVTPATALPGALDREGNTAPGLVGLRLPDRTVDPPDGRVAVRTAASPAPSRQDEGVHRVRPGECLWSIAAAALPREAGPAEVEAAWRLIYRHNRAAVGPDPHLLSIGTTLRLPRGLADRPLRTKEPTPPHHPREDAS